MAQKTFSESGVAETMNLMPNSLQGAAQLKTTINSLEASDPAAQPKPKINA